MSRKRMNGFDVAAGRRRDIERYARTINAARTDRFHRFLLAWQWHRPHSKDPTSALMTGALMTAAYRMGGIITVEEANQIIEEADARPAIRDADALGRYLGLTDEMRTALRIDTIGASDVTRQQRAVRRKKRNRMHNQAKRRARGTKTRAEYLAAVSVLGPRRWEAEGKSRRTWYRHRKAAATESVDRASALSPTSSPSLPHDRQRLPNTEEQVAKSVVTETPCPQGASPFGQPSLGTGSVCTEKRRESADEPCATEKRRGSGDEPCATAESTGKSMGARGNGHEPRLTGNGHDAVPALVPDSEPVCACCGEPGDILSDPLMRDRHGRLVHRRCRDETDWSVPQASVQTGGPWA
jgi:hypothetical protein